MIKATATIDGRQLLMIGLSYGNLDKFRKAPLDTFIKIDGRAMDLPIDVLLFSGETETSMQTAIQSMISPLTVVHIDPKLKP